MLTFYCFSRFLSVPSSFAVSPPSLLGKLTFVNRFSSLIKRDSGDISLHVFQILRSDPFAHAFQQKKCGYLTLLHKTSEPSTSGMSYPLRNTSKVEIGWFLIELPSEAQEKFLWLTVFLWCFLPLLSSLTPLFYLQIGPLASLTFENYDLIWMQIHEMLLIEQGGEAQIRDEVEAYKSLIPNGSNIVTTLMFEIDDKDKRNKAILHSNISLFSYDRETDWLTPKKSFYRVLVMWRRLYNSSFQSAMNPSMPVIILKPLSIKHLLQNCSDKEIGRDKQKEVDEDEVERTNASGKTSSIHFLKFHLTPDHIRLFNAVAYDSPFLPRITINHRLYPHSVALVPDLMEELKKDLTLEWIVRDT